MMITQNVPHLITLFLWCLLVPCGVLIVAVAPVPVRLSLCLKLGQFLFLSFLLFYIWNDTQGNNETLIDLLVRLYMAVDASMGAFAIEHWHLLAKSGSGASAAKSSTQGEAGAKIVLPSPKLDRTKHLVFTIALLVCYWSWLIFDFTQLRLK